MTVQSPRHRIFVTSIVSEASETVADMSTAVQALRRGDARHAVVSGGGTVAWLVLDASNVAGGDCLAELRGFALVSEQSRRTDPADLQPARALRRALADGRMNAAEIGFACGLETGAAQQTRALAALERGLGRFAATTTYEICPDPLVRCVTAIKEGDASLGGALALVITPGVGSIALAFGRP